MKLWFVSPRDIPGIGTDGSILCEYYHKQCYYIVIIKVTQWISYFDWSVNLSFQNHIFNVI